MLWLLTAGQVVHYPGFYSPYGTPYHMYGDMARGGLPHMQFPHLQPPFQPGMVPPGGRPPFGTSSVCYSSDPHHAES